MPNASAIILAFLFTAAWLTSCSEQQEAAPRQAVLVIQ